MAPDLGHNPNTTNPDTAVRVVFLGTRDIALRAGVDTSTVRTWVHDKKLTPAVTTPGGHYRFDPAAPDVVAIIGPTPSPALANAEAAAS